MSWCSVWAMGWCSVWNMGWCSVGNDSGSSSIGLGSSTSISAVVGVVMGLDSISVATIFVVSSISVVSGTSISSSVVVSVPVSDTVLSRSGTVISDDSMVSCSLVVGVSFFVSSALKFKIYGIYLHLYTGVCGAIQKFKECC